METRVAPSPPLVDTRWEVVQRVSASTSFQRSPRLRELLTYICERALQDRPQDLREQVIGCVIFGRKADYNPGEDNIVRVEVRQLRKRLETYFAKEGKDEPFLILIPKGAYVPVFEPRETATALPPPPDSPEIPKISERPFAWRRWAYLSAGLVIVLATLLVWVSAENRRLTQRLATTSAPTLDRSAIWPLIFNDNEETLIVCADSSLVVAESLLHRSVSLDEYLSRDYTKSPNLSKEAKMALEAVPNWQFTDIADVRLVQRLFRLNSDHWDKASIRSAKTTQIQDFKSGNIVLLGSNRSNLWNNLFEPTMNFLFEYDEGDRTASIRNKAPLAGEQAMYHGAKPGKSGDSYSILALVPNLRRTGSVLIIAGTTAEGTESAGELIMNPATSSSLLSMLSQRNKGRIPYFEALLRSGTLSGIAKNAEVIAIRILPGDPPRS